MPCRNPCRFYIHLAFTYYIGPSSVEWSELGPAPSFPPMRVLEVYWSRALSLMCELALIFSNNASLESDSFYRLNLKVCGCYAITFLYQTPRFDWYVVRWGSKSKYHEGICLKENGLHLQILISTLHPIVNTIERTYVFSWEINNTCTSNNHN